MSHLFPPQKSNLNLLLLQGNFFNVLKKTTGIQVNSFCLLGFPGGSVVKNLPASARNTGLIPGLGSTLEKEMAIHSSIPAWEIPWTEEAGGLQFLGLQRVEHNLATKPDS